MVNIKRIVEPLIVLLSFVFLIGYSTPATLLDQRLMLWVYFLGLNLAFLFHERLPFFSFLVYFISLFPIFITQSARTPFVVITILGLCLHLESDWKKYLIILFAGFTAIFVFIFIHYFSWPVTDLVNQILAVVLMFLSGLIIRFLYLEFQEMLKRLQLSERLAAAGALAQGLAHEIKNPLTSISGLFEIVAPEVTKNKDLIEVIGKEIKRLNLLLHDFNDFANPAIHHLERNSVKELLEEVITILRHSDGYQEKGIQFQLEVNEDPRLTFDFEKMKQVLINILKNSISFSPLKGIILLRLNRTQLRIADQGEGFDSDSRKDIFIPFKTKRKGGTGLGLATAKNIIEAHGYKIILDKPVVNFKGANLVIRFTRE